MYILWTKDEIQNLGSGFYLMQDADLGPVDLAAKVELGIRGGRQQLLQAVKVQLLDSCVHREPLGQDEFGMDALHPGDSFRCLCVTQISNI